MSLSIESPGLLTTIQDAGRLGYQKDGMVVSGAMDAYALRLANMLVGNPESAAALEITLLGPTIRFNTDLLISLTGADLSPTINNEPVKMWRPVFVAAGSILAFGAPRAGCRSYLAVAGGFAIPSVMGSHATFLRAGIGGWQGRALQSGDLLPVKGIPAEITSFVEILRADAAAGGWQQADWSAIPDFYLNGVPENVIRVVKGPEYDLFAGSSTEDFWQSDYKVSSHSDRMGYRLNGPTLALATPAELLSGAVTFGTIQVPPDGNPIVLLADHQTTGGYPRIAQVVTADFPKLAQVPPGRDIRFEEISLEEAHLLYIQREKAIESLRSALHLKLTR
ncbi:biotin-dependent carboxyltransferase family protein [Pontibacter liquoris]|uniref:5-oxoprolinase subunit C family protein n=1 Tax=Pontibacter liquoris TaxID=2905677 RepID=UPI001FA7D0AA|nr:biotin-dependent carboxyltransferase family protein [Pontibacter liquoris]